MLAKILGWLILLAVVVGVIWLLIMIAPVVLPIAFGILAVVAWVKNNE